LWAGREGREGGREGGREWGRDGRRTQEFEKGWLTPSSPLPFPFPLFSWYCRQRQEEEKEEEEQQQQQTPSLIPGKKKPRLLMPHLHAPGTPTNLTYDQGGLLKKAHLAILHVEGTKLLLCIRCCAAVNEAEWMSHMLLSHTGWRSQLNVAALREVVAEMIPHQDDPWEVGF
jgi:hypothetical protein